MGSVPVLTTTGDNDPEIDPVRYYRHYLYCDACGSFELDVWITPGNVKWIERTRARLGMAALISLPLVAVGAWLASEFYPPLSVLLAGLIVIVGLLVLREVLGSKIEYVGMRCRQCDSTCRYGSPFFTDLDANPRNLTEADVPAPSWSPMYMRGESVEDEPTKP